MSTVPRQLPAPRRRRGIALVRVSQERDGMTSPDVQRHAIQQYADAHGIDIIEWVEGIDESGSRRRSAWWAKLDAAVGRIESKEADTIIVWRYSRTARNRLRWIVALDRLDVAGGTLESATEQTDNSASGRFARGMLGELNAYQAELIGETWRETHQRRVRQGLPPTGGPRFGYIIEDGQYRPDPATAPVVRELYRLYLAGAGYARLTRWLNDQNLRAERWTYQGVVRMLDSGFAAGLLGHTEVVAGEKRRVPPPWVRRYSPGVHEPIIDEQTWEAYVARRASTTGRRVRARTPYMLSGLLRCADCGGPMHGKRTDGRFTYVCSRSTVTTGVRKVSVVAWRVERFVERWLFSFAEDADAQIAAAASNAGRRRDNDFVLRRARALLEKADERLTQLTLRLADGTITPEAYQAAVRVVEADREAAETTLRAATTNPVEERAPVELPRNLASLWPGLTTEQKNMLLRPLIARVEVDPARFRGDVADRYRVVPRWESD